MDKQYKFKIGDVVRVVSKSEYGYNDVHPIGSTFKVEAVDAISVRSNRYAWFKNENVIHDFGHYYRQISAELSSCPV
jgi:hypothetical protein